MDSWRFEDTDEGWNLIVVPRVPPRFFVPRTRKDRVFAAAFAGAMLFLISLELLDGPPEVSPGHRPSALSLVAGLVILAVMTVITWRTFPWPFITPYRQANLAQRLTVRRGEFENADGVFAIERLATIRATPDGAMPGRLRLVMSGDAVAETPVVGWPGVNEQAALEIREVILRWLEAGAEKPISAVLTSASS